MAEETGLAAVCDAQSTRIYESVGCDHCKQTGYSGRVAIHELFILDNTAKRAVLDGADAGQLHESARQRGMRTLYEDELDEGGGWAQFIDEVLRITQDQTNDQSDP